MSGSLVLRAQRRESADDRTRLRSAIAAASFLVLLILPTAAPSQVSTASLSVQVVGEGEERLPGVTVNVINTETGLQRSGISDENGTVQLLALPPGTYEIAAQLEGMITLASEVFQLMVGQRAQLTVALQPRVTDTIEVTGAAPLVDVHRMDSSTNIIPEQIEELPVPDRQYERLAALTPGVQRDSEMFLQRAGSPIVGASGTSVQTTYMMDGIDLTDPFFGFARVRVSQDAVEEFRVINARFGTEIGGSAGGAISVVTKSGTNRLSGSVFGFYRANELREKGALELEEVDYSRYHLGFTVGGPVALNRTHYFLAVEQMDEKDVALFRPAGAFQNLARDIPHPKAQTMALASLNHQLATSSTGVVKVAFERYREDNYEVGGVSDESHGWSYNRDNLNLLLNHTWVVDDRRLNDLRLQAGFSRADWPKNSVETEERFSSGNTLMTGRHFFGENSHDALYLELRDTFDWMIGQSHQLKSGLSYQHRRTKYLEERFDAGRLVYMTDDRSLPIYYYSCEGSSEVTPAADILGLFVQDDWRIRENLTVSLGLRYDVDIGSNNPDFEHPLISSERGVDWNNLQPRFGFNWDLANNGRNVLRGGIGQFTGRYLIYPGLNEDVFNGETGRTSRLRFNGRLFGLPPEFWLDPDNPENTGLPQSPDIYLLADKLVAPETTQATLGYSRQLGSSGLVFDSEVIYAEGESEILTRDTNYGGPDNPTRLNSDYNWIIRYTNDGRSRYQALVLSLGGPLKGGHLLMASLTIGKKKSIRDDPLIWIPVSDSTNVETDWGRSNSDERYRFVASGVFRLPWNLTLGPVFEYGSGNPWTRVLGYDYNLDGFTTDRLEGVERNDADGRPFRQLSLRLTKTVALRPGNSLDLIVEAFNAFNTTNYANTSIDNAMFLSGPTVRDQTIPYVPNPRFGEYTDTHSPREIQLGMRYRF